MTLRDDNRGRVPFALVGVLLLVSSAAYTGAMTTQSTVSNRTAVERATATVTTAAHAALEQAALRASRTAGARPLTAPANTPMGRVIDGPEPFERYLRLLVYRHARLTFETVSATAGDTTVRPHLPPVRGPETASRAIDRTTIEPVDEGTRMQVTISDVDFDQHRGGDHVGTSTRSLSVTVASPILDLHRRTTRYDQRLDNGPLEGPGLGRRITGGLTIVTQLRGLGQYAGLPIENVLPNRHVELQTNLGAVTLQRDAFGRTDPDSVGALGWATARVGLRDGAAAMSVGNRRWSRRVLDQPALATPGAARDALEPTTQQSRPPPVDAESVADRALVAVTDPEQAAIATAVADAYTIDARLVTATRHVATTTEIRGERPVGGVLHSTSSSTTRHVTPSPAGDLRAPAGFSMVDAVGRRVVTSRRTVRVWRTIDGTTQTVERTTTVTAVTLGAATRYTPEPAPDRPVAAAAGRRRLDAAASAEILGGPDRRAALAKRAVAGDVPSTVQQVSVTPPDGVHASAREAVLETHRLTRNLTASIQPADGASATTDLQSGPAGLRAALAANRTRLLAAPPRYTGPADVARTAARAVYLDAVTTRLETDQARIAGMDGALADVLADRGLSVPDPTATGAPVRSNSGVRVDVTPAYLPVTEVTPRMAPVDQAYHPLAARNVNLFTVPSSDVADTVAGAVVPDQSDTIDVAIAAQTLSAASGDSLPENDSLDLAREELRAHVETGTGHLASAQVRELARTTSLSPAESERLVAGVYAGRASVAARALATTNGTIPREIASLVGARTDEDPELVAARLRVAVDEARAEPAARVPETTVSTTGRRVRSVARTGVRRVVQRGVETEVDRLRRQRASADMAALPAGLPVAPVPGYWYVTVNVWVVDVRGAYHRVEARSGVASPTFGDPGLAYVREAHPVTLDVDGDGSRERLGRVEPVAFDVRTVIVVMVPAGSRGVGDTDGNADERSPGWPGPAAAPDADTASDADTATGTETAPGITTAIRTTAAIRTSAAMGRASSLPRVRTETTSPSTGST